MNEYKEVFRSSYGIVVMCEPHETNRYVVIVGGQWEEPRWKLRVVW